MNEQQKKDQELLSTWENDFHAEIAKYCKGYPAVQKTLFGLASDIKLLLAAQSRLSFEEGRRKGIEDSIKAVEELAEEFKVENFYLTATHVIDKLQSLINQDNNDQESK